MNSEIVDAPACGGLRIGVQSDDFNNTRQINNVPQNRIHSHQDFGLESLLMSNLNLKERLTRVRAVGIIANHVKRELVEVSSGAE